MLNPQEKRKLEQIEQWIETSDPKFATRLRRLSRDSRRARRHRIYRLLLDAFGVALLVLGIVVHDDTLVLSAMAVLAAGAGWHFWAAHRMA